MQSMSKPDLHTLLHLDLFPQPLAMLFDMLGKSQRLVSRSPSPTQHRTLEIDLPDVQTIPDVSNDSD